MRFRFVLIAGALLFMPFIGAAEQVTTWDFTGGQVPGQWNLRDLQAQSTADGVRITTQKDGFLFRATEDTGPIDAVTLSVWSPEDIEANLIWQEKGQPQGRLTQFFFVIPASTEPIEVDVAPTTLRGWNPKTDAIGVGFPAGTRLLLKEMRLHRWNIGEKTIEALKSFWHIDSFRPYSINYLWGPLIVTNPIANAQLFDRLLPMGISALRFFYGLLTIVGIGTVIVLHFGKTARLRRAALATCAVTLIALWLLFDMRMGVEIIRYAATDIRTYVLPPPGKRTLRTHEDFYDIARQALPALQRVPRYALISPNDTPYWQNLRYMTYPSLPVRPGEDLGDLRLLFILQRPDLRVEGETIVTAEGTNVANNGKVLAEYGSGSFLYIAK